MTELFRASSGSFNTSDRTVTATSVTSVDVNVTKDSNTQLDITVKQDESGGTTADNTETFTDVSAGSPTTLTLDQNIFSKSSGSAWWIKAEFSQTNGDSTQTDVVAEPVSFNAADGASFTFSPTSPETDDDISFDASGSTPTSPTWSAGP